MCICRAGHAPICVHTTTMLPRYLPVVCLATAFLASRDTLFVDKQISDDSSSFICTPVTPVALLPARLHALWLQRSWRPATSRLLTSSCLMTAAASSAGAAYAAGT
jgi:hypothetical protein